MSMIDTLADMSYIFLAARCVQLKVKGEKYNGTGRQ